MAGTKTTGFLVRNEPQNISFETVTEDNTRWVGAQTFTYYSVSLLPFLLVHHDSTKVILIGIIFISQILQWSLVNNKMNNFSLGSRTSMVHQNTTQSSIIYP